MMEEHDHLYNKDILVHLCAPFQEQHRARIHLPSGLPINERVE